MMSAIFRDPPAWTKLTILSLFVFLLLVATYFLLVAPNASYVAIWLHDVMALIAASYRTYLGQVPSMDFFSLYGVAVFYPAVLGFRLGLEPSAVLNFGQLVVAAFLLPLAVLASYRRLSVLSSIILVLFLFFLIVAPVPLGRHFGDITLAVYYNRYCWAATAIVFLHYLEPRTIRRADFFLDSLVLILLTVFLFYSKITFAAVAFAFLIVNGTTSKWKFQVSAVSVGVFFAFTGIIEVLTHYNSAYLGDIVAVVQGNPPSRGISKQYKNFLNTHIWELVACSLALIAVFLSGRRKLIDCAFVVGCVIASIVLLGYAYGTTRGLPTLVVVFLICNELARRTECVSKFPGTQGYWPKHAASLSVLGLLIAFVSGPMITNAKSLSIHYRHAIQKTEAPLAGLSGFVVKGSANRTLREVLGNSDEIEMLYAELRRTSFAKADLGVGEYWSSIIDGSRLLESVPLDGQAVVVFSLTNPFDALLQLKPTEYGFPFLWLTGHFNRHRHPTPDQFFSDASYVMVPVIPLKQDHLDTLLELYGPYLEEHFDELKESAHWVLWARKSSAQSSH